ncbi:MAG TPA: YetF domain-containing protein [Egibacteraceae bacterium]|nr:YetF domain-containing protein [Egibacteraceae bacterium]
MLFQDWAMLARTALVVPLAYLALLLAVRLSGKRALAKLNAFDLIVTVALGSVLASVAVSPQVTLASGAVAFALLVGLQYVIAYLSVRLKPFQHLVKARPTLLVRDGTLLDEAMEAQRVTRSEILQTLRQHGLTSLDEAAAVVLETDGTLSVITSPPDDGARSTLENVAGWP